MARKYDRLIRYYDSWFADLQDESKELTPTECWQVMLAIRECQRELTTEPLIQLPLTLRRALSIATMVEQVERIIEKTSSMKRRGSKGGMAAQGMVKLPELPKEELKTIIEPPNDGKDRNFKGLMDELEKFGLSDEEKASVCMAADYGLIGNNVWKIIWRANSVVHKREYLLKSLFRES